MSPLFVPGPVDVNPDVAQQLARPMMPHRSKEFETIFHRAIEKSQKLFYTQYRVFLMTNSGSGAHEACVRNLVKSRVLNCVNGAFGKRWHDVSLANGKQADKLEADWGHPITPEMVADALKADHYEAIMVIHNETSTGVQNPVKEICEVVQQVSPDTLVCVDAVSSLSGVKIEMDAWGIDVLLTSSQKALALPPGLALCGVNDRAMERAKDVPNRGWYFDFLLLEKHRTTNSTPMTPVMSLIFALDYQLDRVFAEGLENRYARHSALAARAQSWAQEKGWPLFAEEGYRSQTLTVINNPPEFDCGAFNQYIAPQDMRMANGYGKLKGQTFRIAHMGEIQMTDLDLLLRALDSFIAEKM